MSLSFLRPRSCALVVLLLALVLNAVVPTNGQKFRRRFCRPVLSADQKALIKGVIGVDVFGCRISRKVALKAAKRLNWLVPRGEGAPVGIQLGRGSARQTLLSSSLGPRSLRRIFKILRRGRLSLKRKGKLRASAACVGAISPDLLVFWLGSVKGSKRFSRNVRKSCGVSRIQTSTRVVPPIFIIILAVIRRCVLIIIVFFIGPVVAIVQAFLSLIWSVLIIIIIYLPCPSNPVRIASEAVKYIA